MSEMERMLIYLGVFFVFSFVATLIKVFGEVSIVKGFRKALEQKDTERAKAILYEIKDVNENFKDGWSYLFDATLYGNSEIISILIDRGAKVNQALISTGETPLHLAIECGYIKAAKVLLEAGRADPNYPDNNGLTPVFYATSPDLIDLLVARGADVNILNKKGCSPLIWALANISITQKKHKTDALFASYIAHDIKYIQALISNGADITQAFEGTGTTPLIFSSKTNVYEAVKLLCENGADVNAQEEDGNTALTHACSNGNPMIVSLLLKNGCNKNIKNNNGETALEIAEKEGHKEIVEILK